MKLIRTVRHSFNTTGTTIYRVQLAVPEASIQTYLAYKKEQYLLCFFSYMTWWVSIALGYTTVKYSCHYGAITETTNMRTKGLSSPSLHCPSIEGLILFSHLSLLKIASFIIHYTFSVNFVTWYVSPLHVFYGVFSNPCATYILSVVFAHPSTNGLCWWN